MINRGRRQAIALMTALLTTIGGAAAFDDAKYPNWKGQWTRAPAPSGIRGQPSFDPSKSSGRGQQAPLTPEYQAIFEANLADQASGGFGTTVGWRCGAWGLPAMMNVYQPMEIIVMPDTTYILTSDTHQSQRRVFTDGRDWPEEIEPAYQGGLSLGKWIDEDGDGRYDVLESETRHFRGPRAYDASGLPLAFDNQSVFKERFFIDKTKPDIIHVLTTVIDNALTRPWTSDRQYRRVSEKPEQWPETWCQEGNANVVIGKENYFLRTDGLLMPAKKNQTTPDLRYFNQPQK